MIKQSDILRAVKEKILEYDQNANIYLKETREGYTRPCYFIDVLPISREQEMHNIYNVSLLIVISYFSNTENSIENMDVLDDLINCFSGVLPVLGRVFTIDKVDIDEVGDNNQEFNLTFSIQYKDVFGAKEKEVDIAKELFLNTKIK